MDAVIRATVREELRRCSPSANQGNNVREELRRCSPSANQDNSAQSEEGSMAARSTPSTFSSRTANRLSGLLNRIRHGSSGKSSSNKKRKIEKEHRIQVRWMHYDQIKKTFPPACSTKEWWWESLYNIYQCRPTEDGRPCGEGLRVVLPRWKE